MRLILLFLLSIGVAYGQPGRELAVGYADRYDSLPTIKFQIVGKQLYDKAVPTSKMVFTNAEVELDTLIVATAKGRITFRKYDDSLENGEGFQGWQYMGYFPSLQMHALVSHDVSEHIGFSDMVLLDSATSDQYGIVSVGDVAVELPVPSPDGHFTAYYYNHVYERNSCFIGILAVLNGKHRLSEKMSFQTKDWAVEDIRWIDANSFVVKAYTLIGQGVQQSRQYTYYRASLDTGIKTDDRTK
ncbi:hypothetical protein [Sphingobacterium siyangense]|uniref:hypothetical protein n=1 Tax=Sphingobacterium siyangense TaxID=459529 RepID=UPI002FD9E90B